ncbi:MAG: hypothetical protein Q9172_004653 [Xanthocarpia lactea]
MLKRALENLSSNLTVLYDDAFSRIESQNQDDRELAEKALRWVAYTYRRFPVRALQEALAINPNETDLDDEAMTPIGLILDVCAGLLILDEEDEIVRLVHYTAQDYFDMVLTQRFDDVHATIACDCVSYLSYECIQHAKDSRNHGTENTLEESSNSEESAESSGDSLTSSIEFPLLWYASRFWAQHAMMANRDARLSTRIHQFITGNPRVMLEEPWNYNDYPWRMPTAWLKPSHGLEIAAAFGFRDELEGFCKDPGGVGTLTDDLDLLHLTARNNQASAIQVLLDQGADIERRDLIGFTPLHYAIHSRALEVAKTLVNNGADIMAKARHYTYTDPKYLTPIAFVRGDSMSEFLDLLLGAGAKIQARDIFDQTPLMQSLIEMNDVQTAEMLLKQLSVGQSTEKDSNSKALLYASKLGATEMVDLLLKYGADINSEDRCSDVTPHMALKWSRSDHVTKSFRGFGMTPLHYAAQGANEDCLLTLIRGGADVNRQDMVKETALHVASKYGNLAGVKVLLAHGANGEAIYLDKTPLISAVERGNEDCVLALLRNGADANAQNDGMSALHMASFADLLDIRVWKEGVTALDLAVLGQHDEIVRLLESLTQSATKSESVPFEEYLFDLLGVSSDQEAEEQLKRRIEEEQKRDNEFGLMKRIQWFEELDKLQAERESKEEDSHEKEQKFEEEKKVRYENWFSEMLEPVSREIETHDEREKWKAEVEKQLGIEKI